MIAMRGEEAEVQHRMVAALWLWMEVQGGWVLEAVWVLGEGGLEWEARVLVRVM
jgi:hypothetical protein